LIVNGTSYFVLNKIYYTPMNEGNRVQKVPLCLAGPRFGRVTRLFSRKTDMSTDIFLILNFE